MILGDRECDPFGGGAFECSFRLIDEALRGGAPLRGITTVLTPEQMLAHWFGADHACKHLPNARRCDTT